MLRRIERTTLSDAVVTQIRDLIIRGNLHKGDRLPPEYELAKQLGVGRSSVREALKALSSAGLIERKPEGTFVTSNMETLTEPLKYRAILEDITIRELFEARRVLEVEFAGLAATRCTQEDVEAMQEVVEKMEKLIDDDTNGFIRYDVEFHFCVAKAAQNRILFEVFTAVRDLLTESQREVVSRFAGIMKRSLEYHKQILSSIMSKNPQKARKVMMEHLKDVEAGFGTVFANREGF